MNSTHKGFWLTIAGAAGAACFLICFKLSAGLGDVADATLVMLLSAALLNTVTGLAHERRRSKGPFDRVSLLLASGMALLTLLGNELAFSAVQRISAPMTSVLQQTQVLFVVLLARVVLNERVTLRFWVGLSIAAIGVYLIQRVPDAKFTSDHVGMSLAAASAACWALMAVYTRKYIHRIRPIPLNALRLWLSIALWFAIHARLPRLPLRPDFLVYCALAGVFGPYLSRTAQMHAVAYISPTKSTLIGLSTPVITLLPAFLVFGTLPSLRELTGSAIMLAGIAVPVLEHWGTASAQPREAA